jgi:hypothetical protein
MLRAKAANCAIEVALAAATKQTNKPGEADGRFLDVRIKAENGAQNLRMNTSERTLHCQSHICNGTGLAATAATGLGSRLPQQQRNWAHHFLRRLLIFGTVNRLFQVSRESTGLRPVRVDPPTTHAK